MLPVGMYWSTSRQTRATAMYHQQFQMGDPLKTLVVTTKPLKVKTDHEQRMADRMIYCANLAVTVPTRTLSRSTSPRG